MNDFYRTRQMLIVEDEPAFARQLMLAVEKLPEFWKIHHYPDASSALEAIEARGFFADLALIDLGLPDVSGLEVIRALRARCPSLLILVISVISAERAVLSAIRAGACGYIHKDDSFQQIARSIHDVLEGNYPISPALARYLFKLAGHPGTAIDCGQQELTVREKQVLECLARGFSYAQTAQELKVSVSTVQTHVRGLYSKLEAHSQVQALNQARARGYLP